MPEHASWLTLTLGTFFKDNLSHNAHALGKTFIDQLDPSWQSFEPILASLLVVALLLSISARVRARMANTDDAVVPEERLTLRTFMEAFLGYFYDMSKSVMGPDRAKRYFPLVGASACFVFFSNVMALIPGMPVATSNLNITFGCALVVFVLFNVYGLSVQKWAYIKHLAGPSLVLIPLIFPVEVISLIVRPITLAVRLMVNMTADHLLLGVIMGLVAVLIPLPVLALGCLVVLIQTLVFALLTAIYIALATEEEAH
jgi:F-type H+-transporting ATPase subunit a